MQRFPDLTLNQKLALLALTLGIGALFISPTRGGAVSIDPVEMAVIVQREVDHVSADDLADWIIQGRADYRLIDLRDEKAFAEYHIPSAELLPITQLADAPLARNEKIVLYSDGGIHSAQAWFLLKARGYRGVYILLGGLDTWRDSVVFPVLAANPTPFQAERNAKLTARAAYFGGAPGVASTAATAAEGVPPAPIAGGAPAAPVAMPKIHAPSAPAGAAAAAAPKKRREGC
jgi:rhodanese-related sulfurtransferase